MSLPIKKFHVTFSSYKDKETFITRTSPCTEAYNAYNAMTKYVECSGYDPSTETIVP